MEHIDVNTDPTPLEAPLELEVDFVLDRPLDDSFWELKVPCRSVVPYLATRV